MAVATMRFDGVIKSWNEERGFGFIEPLKGGDEIYAHITAFPRGMGRPQSRQRVSFAVELGHDGRKCAREVHILRRDPAPSARGSSARPGSDAPASALRLLPVALFAVLYAVLAQRWPVTPSVAIGYLALSLVAFGAYALDKSAARRRRRRLPEDLLLGLGLLGGWPGALVAQVLLRHKTSQGRFQLAFWCTVAINLAVFVTLVVGPAQLAAALPSPPA